MLACFKTGKRTNKPVWMYRSVLYAPWLTLSMGGHLTRRVLIITGRKRQVSLLSYHGTWSPCIVEWLFDAVWYGVLQDTGSGARIAQATIRTGAQTRTHLHALLGYASISHWIMIIMSFPHKHVHSSMNEYCLVEQLCNHWSCSIQGNIPLPVLLTESPPSVIVGRPKNVPGTIPTAAAPKWRHKSKNFSLVKAWWDYKRETWCGHVSNLELESIRTFFRISPTIFS